MDGSSSSEQYSLERAKSLVSDVLAHQRLPMIVCWAIASLAAIDVLHCVAVVRASAPGDTHVRLPAPRPATNAINIQAVLNAHLFGRAPQPGAAPTETQLPLALAGVIATPVPEEGYALIGDQGQPTQLFHTSARLRNGARLLQVYTDRVVLEVDGAQQILRLPKLSPGTGAVFVASAAPTPAPQGLDSALAAVPVDPRQAEINKGWFEGFYARPKMVNGAVAGVQLEPQVRYQRDYGLKRGDILTAINGTPIRDMDAANSAVQQMTDSSVTLTVMRDGVSQTVSISRDE